MSSKTCGTFPSIATRDVSAAARTAGSAYDTAAKALGGTEVSPADATLNTTLVAALQRTAGAYQKAAKAAAKKNRAGFARQSAAVKSGQHAVARAVAALEAAGYDVTT